MNGKRTSNNSKRNNRKPEKSTRDSRRDVHNSGRKGSHNDKDTQSRGSSVPVRGTDNDPSWYARNPSILKDAASLPFSQALGTDVTMPGAFGFAEFSSATEMPGLCVLRYLPSIGSGLESTNVTAPVAHSQTSGCNVAARNVYSFVRHANSGHSNYDAPNLMLYFLAVMQAYAFWAHLARIYGLFTVFAQKNRYLPRTLIEALGVDYESLSGNLAQFRYFINTFSAKLSTFAVPRIFTLVDRWVFLNQSVFVDGETSKAQMYMYAPLGFMRATPSGLALGDNPGLVLDESRWNASSQYKLDDIIAVGNRLLDPLLTNEDWNIMSGDVLKAYGHENLYSPSPIPEDYVTLPGYSEEVLMQIHNSNALGISVYSCTGNTVPKWPSKGAYGGYGSWLETVNLATMYSTIDNKLTDFIVAYASNGNSFLGAAGPKILNMHKEDVTPEDVMVATRCMIGMERMSTNSSSWTMGLTVQGSEVILCYEIHAGAGDNATVTTHGSWIGKTAADLAVIEQASKFKDYPLLYVMSNIGSTSDSALTANATLESVVGELDNYTVVDNNMLRRMNDAAMLSMFNVPYFGSF